VAAPTEQRLETPASAYRLKLGEYGLLDSFTADPVERREPAAGEIEIAVEAAGLNFRDVLRALGMLQEYERQIGITSAALAPFGFECAGTIVAVGPGVADFQVGDAVLAVATGSLRSHMTIAAHLAAPKPEHLSFAAAAAIPLGFLTAYYALEKLAQLQP
jgi:myxalamid-type polyketide synthase MxaB